jgi:sulfur relay (sulfurtransferase) DsrF/TusC family protein
VNQDAVLVVVSVDPEASHRANEAVRIALGVLAGENEVAVALLGDAAKILDAELEDYVDGEDLLKHLATLKRLGQPFHVDRARIRSDSAWNPVGVDVIPLETADLARLLRTSRRTLVF